MNKKPTLTERMEKLESEVYAIRHDELLRKIKPLLDLVNYLTELKTKIRLCLKRK